MNRCSKCKELKFNDDFYKDTRNRSGLDSWCKSCEAEKIRIYSKKNPDKIYEKGHAWAEKHPEKKRETRRLYYLSHLEEDKENQRRWIKEHPEQAHERHYRRRALEMNAQGNFSAQEWSDLKTDYGNRCAYCNCASKKLEPDHVVPLSRGGSNSIDNIIPACEYCNRSKNNTSLLVWIYRRFRCASGGNSND